MNNESIVIFLMQSMVDFMMLFEVQPEGNVTPNQSSTGPSQLFAYYHMFLPILHSDHFDYFLIYHYFMFCDLLIYFHNFRQLICFHLAGFAISNTVMSFFFLCVGIPVLLNYFLKVGSQEWIYQSLNIFFMTLHIHCFLQKHSHSQYLAQRLNKLLLKLIKHITKL